MPAFLDANIVIYATGNDEVLKLACRAVLDAAAGHPGSCLTSAEVLQEVLHVALRRARPQRTADMLELCLLAVHGRVEPVHASDVLWAFSRASTSALQSRDLVHLAVMHRLGISTVISTDRAFDRVDGIVRLDPSAFDSWRTAVFLTED